MQKNTNHKKHKLWRTAGILLAVIVLLVLFRQQPGWVEHVYFRGVYRVVCYLLRPVLNLFPFSVGDVAYLFIIIGIIAGIIRFFIYLFTKRSPLAGRIVLKALIALEVAWLMFYGFWGLNYYRPSAGDLLRLNDTTYTIKDVAKVTQLIIDSANACRAGLTQADFEQGQHNFYQTAQTAVKNLGATSPEFDIISPRVKPSMLSWLLNYIGISGYYNPFSSEAQMNYMMPVFDKPFVACHEISHQTGWAREDEANFSGYVAGTASSDRLLRYSSYYAGVEEFMRYLRRRDTSAHRALRQRISPLVMQDFKTDSAYWVKYQGNAEMMTGIFYDNFLKMNNQPHGLHTYNRMILLTMAWYRRKEHVW